MIGRPYVVMIPVPTCGPVREIIDARRYFDGVFSLDAIPYKRTPIDHEIERLREAYFERIEAARDFIGLWEYYAAKLGPAGALREPYLNAARKRYRTSRKASTIHELFDDAELAHEHRHGLSRGFSGGI